MKCKGFIYRSPEGEWILSKEPNLKTCCIGNKSDQIVLEGDFTHTTPFQAYTVKGKFEEGRLKEATLASGTPFPLFTLLFLLLAFPFLRKKLSNR